jgi:multidrug efflux system membrane fusion protein
MANIQPMLSASLKKYSRVSLVVLSLSFLGACAASEAQSLKAQGGKGKPVPVVIATATQKTLPILVRGTGTVEAYNTVSIKSQIAGQLTGVYFQQGQTVAKDTLLFKIDSRPQESTLMQAEANRQKAIAAVTQAEANREKALAAVNQITANQEKALAGVNQAKANQQKALSGVNQAKADQQKAFSGVNQAKANREKALAGVNQAKADQQKALGGVSLAKANQAKSIAQAEDAVTRADRYAKLLQDGAVSQDQAGQLKTEASANKASVDASQSEVNNAIAGVQSSAAGIENAQAAVRAADAEIENAQAAVRAADAEIENAQAVVRGADADVENAQAAVRAADADMENAQAAVRAADADIESAKAAVRAADAEVEKAKIQLSYSSIFSPINGITGNLKVNVGNLVKDNDTNPLVIISQTHPIYVSFAIPQRMLPEIKKYMGQNGSLKVEALIPKEEARPEKGEITFVDSGVDTTTGTIQLKGTFTNTRDRLSPGQFVNVVLKLAQEDNAIVVPTVAVQTGQKGQYVFVVNSDKTVELRSIKVGNTVENETAIKEGLKPGEKVVIDGQFNLVPGAKIEEKEALGNKGSSATPGKEENSLTPGKEENSATPGKERSSGKKRKDSN